MCANYLDVYRRALIVCRDIVDYFGFEGVVCPRSWHDSWVRIELDVDGLSVMVLDEVVCKILVSGGVVDVVDYGFSGGVGYVILDFGGVMI